MNGATWIIGAGSGYGQTIARYLARTGRDIVISGRNEEKLYATRSLIHSEDTITDIGVQPLDLGNLETLESACGEILEKYPITELIITAAVSNKDSSDSPLSNLGPEELLKACRVNSLAPWLVIRTAFNLAVAENRKLSVVMFTSRAAWANTPDFGFYSISKGLMHLLLENLFEEFVAKQCDSDIGITILDPGEAKTEMNQGSEVNPIVILPAVKHILDSKKFRKIKYIDRNLNELSYRNPEWSAVKSHPLSDHS